MIQTLLPIIFGGNLEGSGKTIDKKWNFTKLFACSGRKNIVKVQMGKD